LLPFACGRRGWGDEGKLHRYEIHLIFTMMFEAIVSWDIADSMTGF
jgi:hypothetical protein